MDPEFGIDGGVFCDELGLLWRLGFISSHPCLTDLKGDGPAGTRKKECTGAIQSENRPDLCLGTNWSRSPVVSGTSTAEPTAIEVPDAKTSLVCVGRGMEWARLTSGLNAGLEGKIMHVLFPSRNSLQMAFDPSCTTDEVAEIKEGTLKR